MPKFDGMRSPGNAFQREMKALEIQGNVAKFNYSNCLFEFSETTFGLSKKVRKFDSNHNLS